ncbi:MAG: beta-ketoacyl-[acyl-carrier-protein] synthase II [Gammaproteobacteria bacterium]|nr:MAG: beta-ketoacyl-[acyl-carrier-protein] synthase II [Gammaproteobacteria bacterium]
MRTEKCYFNTLGMICSIGGSVSAVKRSLLASEPSLSQSEGFGIDNSLPLGLFHEELPSILLEDKKWQSRNNQFALAALNQIGTEVSEALERFGAHRVGVIIGTSTSGIAESEVAIQQWVNSGELPAYYDYGLQEMGATAQFVAKTLGTQGPAYGVSTACSSGAKALSAARRLIRAGICDAVIAGGVDTMCSLTVQGFSSLEAVSSTQCNPFSKNRNGINIGEGAALFLLSSEPKGVELIGVGECSDAHHISAPDPTGAGAVRCMSAALNDGKIAASQVGYVNLHGTATILNDQMEAFAMEKVFGMGTLCSSTKPFTGHTLGAAGAIEAGICWLMLTDMSNSLLPVHLWDEISDPRLPALNFVNSRTKLASPLSYVLSNSFAFGGNNISLLLGRIQ